MAKKRDRAPGPLSDRDIIQLYWDRDEGAIAETDRKYGAYLSRIAYNILHDPEDCEECLNDTLLGAWDTIPPLWPEALLSYLAKLMRNIACKRLKQKTRQKRVPTQLLVALEDLEGVLSRGQTPAESYAAAELGRLVNEYLGQLDARRRYIFVGRFIMGDTLEDIGQQLGVNASTVHREIEKIKGDLKAHLERNGYEV